MTALGTSVSSLFSLGALRRFALYLALWLVLIGFTWTDFAVGVLAAACATWVSVLLLPVSGERFSPTALARLAVRLPWQALIAPGFITYSTGLASEPARAAFCALTSLQPGTLPVRAGQSGELLIHCLDTSQPVAAQLAAEEKQFARVFGTGTKNLKPHD
ncbi:MAG: Na+/H+ antiporter subunit E [Hyphomicrobium sp.]|nr:Na+/H+ antiporter subunit E [Hyphomicrobium sp.]